MELALVEVGTAGMFGFGNQILVCMQLADLVCGRSSKENPAVQVLQNLQTVYPHDSPISQRVEDYTLAKMGFGRLRRPISLGQSALAGLDTDPFHPE